MATSGDHNLAIDTACPRFRVRAAHHEHREYAAFGRLQHE